MTSLKLTHTHTEAEVTTCRARDLPGVAPRERGPTPAPHGRRTWHLPTPTTCFKPDRLWAVAPLLPLPRAEISKLPAHHLCLHIKFYWYAAPLIHLLWSMAACALQGRS